MRNRSLLLVVVVVLSGNYSVLLTAAETTKADATKAGATKAGATKAGATKTGVTKAEATKADATLAKKVQARVDQADAQLNSPDEAIGAAVTLVEIYRVYGKSLPTVTKGMHEKLVKYRKNPERRELLKQADLVDKANVVAAKNPAKGLLLYQTIVDKYPDTPVAALAETKIQQLKGQGNSTAVAGAAIVPVDSAVGFDPAAGSVGRVPSPEKVARLASSMDPNKLASIVKMAKVYAARNPEKAREFLQKVITSNPDSPAAAEAQKLLDSLAR